MTKRRSSQIHKTERGRLPGPPPSLRHAALRVTPAAVSGAVPRPRRRGRRGPRRCHLESNHRPDGRVVEPAAAPLQRPLRDNPGAVPLAWFPDHIFSQPARGLQRTWAGPSRATQGQVVFVVELPRCGELIEAEDSVLFYDAGDWMPWVRVDRRSECERHPGFDRADHWPLVAHYCESCMDVVEEVEKAQDEVVEAHLEELAAVEKFRDELDRGCHEAV
jgi:hypothetical protein